MGESNASVDEDLLLKEFFAEVSEVERDNEVVRFSLFFFGNFLFTFFFPLQLFFLRMGFMGFFFFFSLLLFSV